MLTSHKEEPTSTFWFTQNYWGWTLKIKNSRIEWDLKEKLDVTLERPDVTLYDLIDLLVCHFVLFSLFLLPFYWGVCQRMFAVVFAFILEDCVLPVSVCHPTTPAKKYF